MRALRAMIRYLTRTVGLILLIMLAGVCALVILARTPVINRWLRDAIVAFAAANFHGQLNIVRIEGSLWGGLRLEQVTLVYGGKTIASIPQVSLDYSLVPLLWLTVRLRIVAKSPQIVASRKPSGKWDLLEAISQRPSTSSMRLPISIVLDSVQVMSGLFEIMPGGDGGPNYRITNLNLEAGVRLQSSGTLVNLRGLTAKIAGPRIPPTTTNMSLDYDATISPATVHFNQLDLRTGQSRISIKGEALIDQTRSIDLDLSLHTLSALDVARFYPPSPLKADLDGTITLQGPLSSLRSVIALSSGQTRLEGTVNADITQKAPRYAVKLKVSKADLQKLVRVNGIAGIIDATVDAKGAGSDPGALIADVHLNGRKISANQYTLGTLELAAIATNKIVDFTAKLASAGGYLTSAGMASLAPNPAYHVEFAARHLNIARTGIAGNLPQTNINFTAVIDGRGVTPVTADTRIRVGVDRSQAGPIIVHRGLVDLRLANNYVAIARLHFDTANSVLEIRGGAGLAADAKVNISYSVHSQDLREWFELARMKGSGSLDLDGNMEGLRSSLWSRGQIVITSLQSAGYSLQHGTTRFNLALTGNGAPYGRVDSILNGVNAGAELRGVGIMLEAPPGLPHVIALRLIVTDKIGRKSLVATHLTYQPGSIAGQLTEMSLDLPGGYWHLAGAAGYIQNRSGISISGLRLQSGDRELAVEGNIASDGPQNFNLALNRFDLTALSTLTPRLHKVNGMLSAKLQVAGTAAAPQMSLTALVSELGIARHPVGGLKTSINYGGGHASFDAVLRQNDTDHLTATGSIPMSLSWNHGVKARIGDAIDLAANSERLSLVQLGSVFPEALRDFDGEASIKLRVKGTLKHPEPAGSIRISGVRGKIIPIGTTISSASLSMVLFPEAIHLETIEAHAGEGTVTGNGEISIFQRGPGSVRIKLNFDRWPAIDTGQYAATVGGYISAEGTPNQPRLYGQLEILNAIIQPDIAFLSATSNLAQDDTIEVIRPGQPISQLRNGTGVSGGGWSAPRRPANQPLSFNNLFMRLGVVIHRNTWIRHPNASAELEGNLDLDKDPGGPVRVIGELRTVRGWMNYFNRQFTLETGVFTFTGGRKIDPQLDINAQNRVASYTVNILIGGTASKPTLQLKSQPELAQTDILSLILFGTTTATLGQSQLTNLRQQATRIASGVAAQEIGQTVLSSMGLQQMGITLNQMGSGGTALGIGRYLGENIYVSTSRPVGSGGQMVSVQYFIRRWLSVTTSTATDGSHQIDLSLLKQY